MKLTHNFILVFILKNDYQILSLFSSSVSLNLKWDPKTTLSRVILFI